MSDCVNTSLLPESEVQSLSEQVARYSHIVRSYRSTHYGWMDMDTFRSLYKKGSIISNPEVTHAMSCLRDLSGRMVYGFTRLAFSIASSFRAAPGTQKHDDYVGECLTAIDQCVYGYDGNNKFITYLTVSMQRRLINYKKREKDADLSGMHSDGEKNTSPIDNAPDYRSNETTLIQEVAAIESAIEIAGLSELERALIEADLRGEKGFRVRIAKQFFNPGSKKSITRMSACNAYNRALEKIRCVMTKMHRQAA